MENVSGGAEGGNYYSAGFAYNIKGKGRIIQTCFLTSWIYCVAEDRDVAFLPMKK